MNKHSVEWDDHISTSVNKALANVSQDLISQNHRVIKYSKNQSTYFVAIEH